jgi:hypothetical protein
MNNNLNNINSNLIQEIRNQYKINIEVASFANGFIPKHIILDRTRNIHSYLTFIKITSNKIFGEYFSHITDFLTPLLELIRTQYSQLDRPLFFLYVNDMGDIQGIESNQIRIHLLENGSKNIIGFIKSNSISGQNLFKQIKSEL